MDKINELIDQLETDILDANANEKHLEKSDFQYNKEKHPINIELSKAEAKYVIELLQELKQSRQAAVSFSVCEGQEKQCTCAASSYGKMVTINSNTHFKAICDNCKGYILLPYLNSTNTGAVGQTGS